jgi:hypothetical protein
MPTFSSGIPGFDNHGLVQPQVNQSEEAVSPSSENPAPVVNTCKMCFHPKDPTYSSCSICNLCHRCCLQGRNQPSHCRICEQSVAVSRGFIYTDNFQSEKFFSQMTKHGESFIENRSKRLLGCELEIAEIFLDNIKEDPEKGVLLKPLSNRLSDNLSSKVLLRKSKETGGYLPYVNAVVRDVGGIVAYDGSIPGSGFEIATTPTSGDGFVQQIRTLTSELKTLRAKVNTACGFHLHVGCPDFLMKDIVNFCRVYYLIEDALFACLPESRRSNRYCMRLKDELNTLNIFSLSTGTQRRNDTLAVKLAYGMRARAPLVTQYKRNKKPSTRYRAVNFSSWFYRQTIEIRMAAGTVSREKIVNWGLFWSNLCDMVKTRFNSLDRIKTQLGFKPDLSREESFDILMAVCPSDKVRNWFKARYKNFQTSGLEPVDLDAN